MATPASTLLNDLAAVGNQALHHHWHTQLCQCGQPDTCPNYPPGTWNIGDSLRLVLPQVLAAYDHAKEQQ